VEEKLIPFTVLADFSDGNLFPLFKTFGYDAILWKAGRVRRIPRSLALRAKQSGAQLVIPEVTDPHDNFKEPGAPVIIPTSEVVETLRQRYLSEPFLTLISQKPFMDGSLADEFSALDRPPVIGEMEIIKLPRSLAEKCISSGAELSTEKELIEQFSGAYQFRFVNDVAPVTTWRRERDARIHTAQAKADSQERLQSLRESAIAKLIKAAKLTEEEVATLEFLL
jgi:hypothetical protein